MIPSSFFSRKLDTNFLDVTPPHLKINFQAKKHFCKKTLSLNFCFNISKSVYPNPNSFKTIERTLVFPFWIRSRALWWMTLEIEELKKSSNKCWQNIQMNFSFSHTECLFMIGKTAICWQKPPTTYSALLKWVVGGFLQLW